MTEKNRRLGMAIERHYSRRIERKLAFFLDQNTAGVTYRFFEAPSRELTPLQVWNTCGKRGRNAAVSSASIRIDSTTGKSTIVECISKEVSSVLGNWESALWFEQFPTDRWLEVSPPITTERLYVIIGNLDYVGMMVRSAKTGVRAIREQEYQVYALDIPETDILAPK